MQVSRQLCQQTGQDAELGSLLQQLLWEYRKRLVNPRSEPRELTIALQVVGALTPAAAHLLGRKVCSAALCLLSVCECTWFCTQHCKSIVHRAPLMNV